MAASPEATIINTFPQGLADLLGTKAYGHNPYLLSQTVQPILDMLPFYVAFETERAFSTVFAVAAIGTTVSTLTVPAGEVWMVDYFTAQSNGALGVGITMQGKCAITAPDGNPIFRGEESPVHTAGHALVCDSTQRILVPPGSGFGITTTQIAGGPQNCLVGVSFVRLRI